MSSKALLFMPDISGFTEFVNQTEVQHSGHIISELLEILLDANTLNLQLAEIEGDALFMFKTDSIPDFEELMTQVKQMFIAFHQHLLLYKHRRICNCGACSGAGQLTLKFVIHISPIDFIEVRGQRKPYGPEIVKLHRLLKNDVNSNEYVLFSEEAIQHLEIKDSSPFTSYETTYDFGTINYSAQTISHFQKEKV